MADQPLEASSGAEKDWAPKQSMGRAFRDIAICAIVLGGGLYFYYHRTQVKKEVYEAGKAAREQMLRDNPKDLLAAREKFAEGLKLNAADGFSVSSTALIDVLLAYQQGMEGEKGAAEEWNRKSEETGANIDERFSANALWLVWTGKTADASSFLDGVVQKGAAGAGIADALGFTRRAEGKLDLARGFFKKAHDLGWRNARYADDLGDTYYEEGDWANAQGFYQKGLEANSEHLRSMISDARASIARTQNMKKASETLTAVLSKPADELSPRLKAMALTGESELNRFEQKFDDAEKLADSAIAADPSFPWSYESKGITQAWKNNPAAGASFDKAISQDPRIAVFYFNAARSMAHLKDATKADQYMAAYTKVLKVDDRYHVVYGDLLRDLGNTDKALSEYMEATKANNFNAAAHYDLGTLLIAKNDLDRATKELGAALGAQQTYPDAYVQLGNINFIRKDFPTACESYAQALVQMKLTSAPREKIDGLLEDVNQRLLKAGEKKTAALWEDQAKQLVR